MEWHELCTNNLERLSLSYNQQGAALLVFASKNGKIQTWVNFKRFKSSRQVRHFWLLLLFAQTHLHPPFQPVIAMKFALDARFEMNVVSSFSASRSRSLGDKT